MIIQLLVLVLSAQARIVPTVGQVAVVLETVGHTTSGEPYLAVQRYDLTPDQDMLDVPRDRLRPGHYLMSAMLIVNTTTDPAKERVAALDAVGFDEPLSEAVLEE
jgi:hypothetical protein